MRDRDAIEELRRAGREVEAEAARAERERQRRLQEERRREAEAERAAALTLAAARALKAAGAPMVRVACRLDPGSRQTTPSVRGWVVSRPGRGYGDGAYLVSAGLLLAPDGALYRLAEKDDARPLGDLDPPHANLEAVSREPHEQVDARQLAGLLARHGASV